jgi:hypothetical protein
LLKSADRTSNLRTVAPSPPSHWDDREYVAWSAAVAAGLVGVREWLDGEHEKDKALALESISDEAV